MAEGQRTEITLRHLVAAAVLAGGGALSAAPAPAPDAPPRLYPERALPARTIPQALGFNLHILGPDKDLDAIRDAGVQFVRKDLFWNHAERGKGSYDFGGFERMLDGLEKRGIRALFILCYQNELYPRPENDADGRAAYARFAAAAAKRFKGRKVLWELWNEPNVMHFWKGPGDHNSDALSVHPYGFARPELCIREGYGHLRGMMAAAGAPKDFPVLNTAGGMGCQAAGASPGGPAVREEADIRVRGDGRGGRGRRPLGDRPARRPARRRRAGVRPRVAGRGVPGAAGRKGRPGRPGGAQVRYPAPEGRCFNSNNMAKPAEA